MEIIVSGRHIDMTDAIRQYASDKVSKLPRYFDKIQKIEVVIDQVDHTSELEIIVHVDHAEPFICKTSGLDLYRCIDEAVKKLERQLTEHKAKLRNHKHKINEPRT